jgi:ferritin
MIDVKLQDAINKQINYELYSGYLYLSMSAKFGELGMAGGQSWMHVQFQEELAHAQFLFDYLIQRNGKVELGAIKKPPVEWEGPLAMFVDAYGHEQKVTGRINDLVDLALKVKDHTTVQFLNWFLKEQVEEEATASEMCDKLKLVADTPAGLYELDKEWAARVFTAPVGPMGV